MSYNRNFDQWTVDMGQANAHSDNAAAQIFLALGNIGRTLAIIADHMESHA